VACNGSSFDLTVALDGTWQKCEHTSLNSMMSATSTDTDKVIDMNCWLHLAKGVCKSQRQ
jgi:hypothetical protein